MSDYWSDEAIEARRRAGTSLTRKGRARAIAAADPSTAALRSLATTKRRHRAVPLDPRDPRTWHEVNDLQPRLKERFRIAGWTAVHVRKQGDQNWEHEHEGLLETVPATASYGYPDWFAIHPASRQSLWIELKSERAHPNLRQAVWLQDLALTGFEVSVLHPRHFFADSGLPDIVIQRLELDGGAGAVAAWHGTVLRWTDTLVRAEMTVEAIMRL